MKPYSIPKKYAPYTPTPFAEVKVPPEVFVGFLYSYYFNIELHPTLTYGSKKCYLAELVGAPVRVIGEHFKIDPKDVSREHHKAIMKTTQDLEERRQLYLELASDANPTLLKIPRNHIENDD